MNGFDLIYIRKTDGSRVFAKRMIGGNYKLLDPETNESTEITRHLLSKFYRCDRKATQKNIVKRSKQSSEYYWMSEGA
jgi:hypothetical protein